MDSNGDIWVCDRGPQGNYSYLKEFTSGGVFKAKKLAISGGCDYCSGLAILKGDPDYIFSTGGEMVVSNHIARWVETQDGQPPELVNTFNYFGTGNDQSYACWGGCAPGSDMVVSTCWFACKVQHWKADGTWIKTFRSTLRSDAYSIKCKNTSAQAKQAYQRVNLAQGTYAVQFLAFTDGSNLAQNQDVVPYAERAVGAEPTGNNAITSPSYGESVLTYVNFAPPGNQLYYFVTGAFTVQQAQSGDWFVGLQVQPNKTAYLASLCCLKQ